MGLSTASMAAAVRIALAIALVIAQWPMGHPCLFSGGPVGDRVDGVAFSEAGHDVARGCKCPLCITKRPQPQAASGGCCPPAGSHGAPDERQDRKGDDSGPCDHGCNCRAGTQVVAAAIPTDADVELVPVARQAVAQPAACDHLTVLGVFHPPRAA